MTQRPTATTATADRGTPDHLFSKQGGKQRQALTQLMIVVQVPQQPRTHLGRVVSSRYVPEAM